MSVSMSQFSGRIQLWVPARTETTYWWEDMSAWVYVIIEMCLNKRPMSLYNIRGPTQIKSNTLVNGRIYVVTVTTRCWYFSSSQHYTLKMNWSYVADTFHRYLHLLGLVKTLSSQRHLYNATCNSFSFYSSHSALRISWSSIFMYCHK